MKVKKTEYTLLEKQYEFLFGIPKEKLNNPNKIYNDPFEISLELYDSILLGLYFFKKYFNNLLAPPTI